MAIAHWRKMEEMVNRSFICGHCGVSTGSNTGYWKQDPDRRGNTVEAQRTASIYLCMRCEKPTFFDELKSNQVPTPPYGNEVSHLPDTIRRVYAEARNCMIVSAYTAAALMCRKILMSVAVEEGADPGESFMFYIDYFKAKSYIPPKGDAWYDYIRKKGNEATHKMPEITKEDAELTINFVQMILVMVYEFHGKLAAQSGNP